MRQGRREREEGERERLGREKREKRPLTKRFTRLFAATNNLFMESALKPLRERQKERTNDRKGETGEVAEERGEGGGRRREERDQNPSSEFLILRNRRRIPERFHSGPAISGISLAPFPGTPTARRARVNGLFGFTDSCPPLPLSPPLFFPFLAWSSSSARSRSRESKFRAIYPHRDLAHSSSRPHLQSVSPPLYSFPA